MILPKTSQQDDIFRIFVKFKSFAKPESQKSTNPTEIPSRKSNKTTMEGLGYPTLLRNL